MASVVAPDAVTRGKRRLPSHALVLVLAAVLAVVLPVGARALSSSATGSTGHGTEITVGEQQPMYRGAARTWSEIRLLQQQGRALFVVSAETDNGPVAAAFDTKAEQDTFLRSLQQSGG